MRVVIEGEFRHRGDIAGSKKGEIVDLVGAVIGGGRNDFGVWGARVVHESGRRAILLAIDDVEVPFILAIWGVIRVIVVAPVQSKKI